MLDSEEACRISIFGTHLCIISWLLAAESPVSWCRTYWILFLDENAALHAPALNRDMRLQEAAIYLRHELEAHALAYKAIKALPGESQGSQSNVVSRLS
jgi:hypothetical protein